MYRIGIKNAIFTLCKGWHFLCNIIYVTFHNIFYNIFYNISYRLSFNIFNVFIVSLNYFCYLSLLSVSLCIAFF